MRFSSLYLLSLLSLNSFLISAPFEGLQRAFREERAALTSMQRFAPGLRLGNAFSYTKGRLKQSGIPIALSVGSTALFSLLFERFAKTHSRSRAKKMAVLSYLLAALYGSQLRQRGEPFNQLSLTDAHFLNRLLLLFGSSVAGTFLLNIVSDWYRGGKGEQATLKQNLAWAVEMGVFNTYAFAAAYLLDQNADCPVS